MSRRINITFSDREYEALTEKYRSFIKDYDFSETAPPTLTGYCAAVIICTLNITESSKEEKI